jgi:hypothetical protein
MKESDLSEYNSEEDISSLRERLNEVKMENRVLRFQLTTRQNIDNRNFKPHTYQLDGLLNNSINNNSNNNNNNNNIDNINNNNENSKTNNDKLEQVDEVNNWSKRNYDTVRKWQSDIEKSSLIHEELLNTVSNNLQCVLIGCLIAGSLITLFSALSVTLGFLDNKVVPIVFNILILLAGIAITIMTGIIKIKNWENLLIILSKLVEKLDSTWFLIDSELSMEPEERMNGKDFIRRCDEEYTFLMRQCPPINLDAYANADRKYKERLYNNHLWLLNFRQKAKEEIGKVKNKVLNEIVIEN